MLVTRAVPARTNRPAPRLNPSLGLLFANRPGLGALDLVTGVVGQVETAHVALVDGPYGPAWEFSGGQTTGVQWPGSGAEAWVMPTDGYSVTVGVTFEVPASGVNGKLFGRWINDSSFIIELYDGGKPLGAFRRGSQGSNAGPNSGYSVVGTSMVVQAGQLYTVTSTIRAPEGGGSADAMTVAVNGDILPGVSLANTGDPLLPVAYDPNDFLRLGLAGGDKVPAGTRIYDTFIARGWGSDDIRRHGADHRAKYARRVWVPVSAAAGVAHASAGDLAAASATSTGAASRAGSHPASGALSTSDASAAGSAARKGQHPASGALGAQFSAASGVANRVVQHAAAGSLAAQLSAIAGVATIVLPHVAAGAPSAGPATAVGVATRSRSHSASGALASDAAATAGVSARTYVHTAIAAFAANQAAAAGAASRANPIPSHAAFGSPSAGAAALSAAAARVHLHGSTGGLLADSASLAGAATHTKAHVAGGALVSGPAEVAGVAYIGSEPPPTSRLGGFEMGGAGKPRRVPEVDRKPLLQRILEARAVKVELPKAKTARRRAKAIEVEAAEAVLADGGEQQFRALMQQWTAQAPTIPDAQGATTAFMAQVHRRILEIQDEDDVLALLLE